MELKLNGRRSRWERRGGGAIVLGLGLLIAGTEFLPVHSACQSSAHESTLASVSGPVWSAGSGCMKWRFSTIQLTRRTPSGKKARIASSRVAAQRNPGDTVLSGPPLKPQSQLHDALCKEPGVSMYLKYGPQPYAPVHFRRGHRRRLCLLSVRPDPLDIV